MKWAAMASGTGSILDAFYRREMFPDVLLVDVEDCRARKMAEVLNIPVIFVPRTGVFRDGVCDSARAAFSQQCHTALQDLAIELVVMSGFDTVLAPEFFYGFGAVLNIHPSLLPKHKGAYAVADALAEGVEYSGSTVHMATALLDDGPVVDQITVPVEEGDTEETLWERIKVAQRRQYPEIVQAVLAGTILLEEFWKRWLAMNPDYEKEMT